MAKYIDNLKFLPDVKTGGTSVLTGFPGSFLKPFLSLFSEDIMNMLPTISDARLQDDLYVFRNGIGCAKRVYINIDGTVNWEVIKRLHAESSATIYLRACQRYFAAAKVLCRDIENHLVGTKVFINLFATPSNSVGLQPHLDPTEFFVLQVSGSKIWHFWRQPTLDELAEMNLEQRAEFARHIADANDETLVVELRAGQIMYVPRFKVHAPRAGGCGSVHVTIGIASAEMKKYYD